MRVSCILPAVFSIALCACSIASVDQELDSATTLDGDKRKPNCLSFGGVKDQVCGYSFIEVVNGDVPDRAIAIYGYLVKGRDGIYLFMSRESVAGKIYRESLFVSAAPDYEEHPELYNCKFVQVVGYFTNKAHHVHDQLFSTSGRIRAESVRFSNALPAVC